jgi:hypothetical protein
MRSARRSFSSVMRPTIWVLIGPRAGEQVGHRLGVETDDALEQHRVERAAGALPRVGALLVFEPEQLQPVGVGVAPFPAVGFVLGDELHHLGPEPAELGLGEHLGQVGVERGVGRVRLRQPVEVHGGAAIVVGHDRRLVEVDDIAARVVGGSGRDTQRSGVSHQ